MGKDHNDEHEHSVALPGRGRRQRGQHGRGLYRREYDDVAPQNYDPYSYQFDGPTKINMNMYVIDK